MISYKESIKIRENAYKEKYNIKALNKEMSSDLNAVKIIEKMQEYNIPIDEKDLTRLHSPTYMGKVILFCELEDIIAEWENLLEQAENFNINWNYYNYDPLALKGIIEEMETEERKQYNLHLRDYNSERGLI